MLIVEIRAQENGAHRNQRGNFSAIPEGWAEVPASVPVPGSFPFVEVEASGRRVTALRAGTVPEPEPEPEPAAEDDTDAMLIDHEYRLTLLELGVE